MIEILCIYKLVGVIGCIARRRARSQFLFALWLLFCWLGGEAGGAAIGYALASAIALGEGSVLLVYGLALAGAILGTGAAFVAAKSSRPVDGIWRNPADVPICPSLGAIHGGLSGLGVGILLACLKRGGDPAEINLSHVTNWLLAPESVSAN